LDAAGPNPDATTTGAAAAAGDGDADDLDADVLDDDVLDDDVLDADVLDADVLDDDVLDADVLDADVPDDDDDDLRPSNAPVGGVFFLVNKLRNFAPNPFLGDEGGLEAAELTEREGAFFLAIQLDTFLKPAAATNFAFDLILTPMGRDGGDADVDADEDDLLPNNAPV